MENVSIRQVENGYIITINNEYDAEPSESIAVTFEDMIDIVSRHFYHGDYDASKAEALQDNAGLMGAPLEAVDTAEQTAHSETLGDWIKKANTALFGEPVSAEPDGSLGGLCSKAELADRVLFSEGARVTREEALKTADAHADPEFDGVAKTEDIKPIAGDVYKRYVETPFIPLRDPVADTRVLAEQAKTNGIDEDAST
jgi:hypothetical protein